MFCEVTDQIPGDLGDPGTARVPRHAEDVDFPSAEFDHEQDVELGEEDRVHREEVRGQDAGRLGSQELGPRGSTSRSRPEPMTAQHTANRGAGDSDAELPQFALDAHAAPAAVLRAEPDDEGDHIGIEGRTAGATLLSPPPPLAPRCFSVPAQQGLGR